MPIDFEVEPEFQERLDWVKEFVVEQIEPLDLYFRGTVSPFDKSNETAKTLIAPLQKEVQERDLWACHIGPELGGKGYGQVKLALMNEILGRSGWAPSLFGCQAPDSGNAEILAIAVDGTSGTFLLVDQQNRPLTPGLMYNDLRAAEVADEVVVKKLIEDFRKLGV